MSKKKKKTKIKKNIKEGVLENKLDSYLVIGFYLLIFFLPLLISRITFEQFDLPKVVALNIVTQLMLFIWLMKILLISKTELHRTKIDYLALILLVLMVIATIFSWDKPTAIFGKYRRYEGLITFIDYLLLLFLAAQTFRGFEKMKTIIRTMTLISFAVAIYGIIQWLGLDPLPWATLPFEERRSFSTFGNPALLGGYIALMLPVAFGNIFSVRKRSEQFLYSFGTLLLFICLITTFTRGAWVSALIGVIVFLFLSLPVLIENRRLVFIIFGIFFALLVVLVIISSSAKNPTLNVIERFRSIFIIKGSVSARLEIWKSAVNAVEKRPLIGYGPDNFRLAFAKYQTPGYSLAAGRLSIADNAHNYFLQLATTGGIFTSVIFIFLLGLFFWFSISSLLKEKDKIKRLLLSSLTVSVFVYLIHIFFTLSVVGTTSLMWIMIGMVSSQYLKRGEITLFWRRQSYQIRLFVVIISAIMTSILTVIYFLPFAADVFNVNGSNYARAGNFELSVKEYDKAIRLTPYNDRYHADKGTVLLEWGRQTQDVNKLNQAATAYQDAILAKPKEADNYLFLADTYLYMANIIDPSYIEKAKQILDEGVELKPLSANIRFYRGVLFSIEDDLDRAEQEFNKALDGDPRYYEALYELGEVYRRKEQVEKAKDYYKKALEIKPDFDQALKALASLEKTQ